MGRSLWSGWGGLSSQGHHCCYRLLFIQRVFSGTWNYLSVQDYQPNALQVCSGKFLELDPVYFDSSDAYNASQCLGISGKATLQKAAGGEQLPTSDCACARSVQMQSLSLSLSLSLTYARTHTHTYTVCMHSCVHPLEVFFLRLLFACSRDTVLCSQ